MEIERLHLVSYLSTLTFAQVVPAMEQDHLIRKGLNNQLFELLTSLRLLTEGKLNSALISPVQLQRILNQTLTVVHQNYRDYDLLFNTTGVYYSLPTARYKYNKETNSLLVQLPVYLHHFKDPVLDLFQIHTVQVPYHMNSFENSTQGFTQLQPTKSMLAVTANSYISLDSSQLVNCVNI